MIESNYQTRGLARCGIVVPVSNTNLEPDMMLLAPAGVSMHFARAGGYDVDQIPDENHIPPPERPPETRSGHGNNRK